MNKSQLVKICQAFELGTIIGDATSVNGGLIHKMWRINTSHGRFAIKELNAAIMQRPNIREHYCQTEIISAAIACQKIPAIPALLHQGTPLYDVDGMTVMVFPWVAGDTLLLKHITTTHAKMMGALLAQIHSSKLTIASLEKQEAPEFSDAHWQSMINAAHNENFPWAHELNITQLITWTEHSQEAQTFLNNHRVVSHRDLDPKNVLWADAKSPFLVDWESAGWINPTQELITVAIEWSGMTETQFNPDIFLAIIESYCQMGGKLIRDEIPHAVHALIGGYLNWLEFNVCRSLSSVIDDAHLLGQQEVALTLRKLNFLQANILYFVELSKNKGV